ncbi:MAG TPA: response regulator [Tepidisphaeraceae bacterium]|nr:response regulator [Tepidisphaeraceae bacterium]
MLEGNPLDAELAVAHLVAAGLGSGIRRVGNREEFLEAIADPEPANLIISDYDVAGFDRGDVLRLARERWPQAPFIFLSGQPGEQHAVESLRLGATDHVLKQRIEQLGPAVQRALSESTRRIERSRADSQIDDARRRSAAAIIAGQVGTYEWDLSGDRLHGDEIFLRLFDVQPDASGTVSLIECMQKVPEEDRVQVAQAIGETMVSGDRLGAEYRIVTGGQERWVAGRAQVERDSDGLPCRLAGVIVDITDRKRAEKRLGEESKVVEMINEVGRSLSAELELNKIVQLVTDATTQLTGAEFGAFFYNAGEENESYSLYSLSGISRKRFDDLPMPSNTEVFAQTFKHRGALRIEDVTADPRYGRNSPHAGTPPGHPSVRSYLAVPVISRSGAVLGALLYGHGQVGVFRERHERIVTGIAAQAAVAIDNAHLFETVQRANAEKDKLLESERAARADAERASQLKDEFLATLSHELRTPLSAILGWTHVLRRHVAAGDPEISEGLGVIERNARVQVQLVEDLLDMSRIISGKIRLDVQRVPLADVLEASYETVRPAAEAKGVRIRKVIDPLAGPVSGDPNRLQQIVWNLLNNAVKFTPRGGRVDLLLERVNSHVEVTVHDTGDGIAPDFLPHVFDRFRQADGTTTRHHGGLGLGLSIVKHLVELHGGSVRAKSLGIGKGSTFVVELPVAPVRPDGGRDSARAWSARHPSAAVARETDECYPRLDGVLVLVVDDDADARELMRRVLADCGAEVMLASDATAALDIVKNRRPRVIVSDIGMPAHDGYELIRWIRALPESDGGRTPAIALTAFARSEDRRRAIAAGYQTHLSKPADTGELVTVVGSLAGVLPG